MMPMQESEAGDAYEQESNHHDGYKEASHDFSKNCPLLGRWVFTFKIIPSVQGDIAGLYLVGLAINPLHNISLDQPNRL